MNPSNESDDEVIKHLILLAFHTSEERKECAPSKKLTFEGAMHTGIFIAENLTQI
jgi:hypothetical protein